MNRSLLVGMVAGVALATPQAASADIVTDWASYADRLDTAATRSELNFPGQAQVGAAMFEAADAIDRRYEPLLGMKPAPRGASMDAAIITAAHDVLAACYPDDKKRIDENARFALDALPDSAAAKAAGAAVGAEAARLAMTHGTRDPSVALHPYAPFTQAGKWVPTRLPVFGTFTQAMRPWAIGRIDAVMSAEN